MSGAAGGGGRDIGLQPERTRLAWRRTTLACSVVAVLALRQALRGAGGPLEVGGAAVIALIWLAFLGVAHRRIRSLAAARPPGLAPGAALAAAACTVGLAAFAVAVVV
ncbi:hypothetical protein AMK16_30375 [Streptomyces sp. CB00455]|uniref:DUF202 domain-containing protein n=1 Tax=Streptomyces sp. CB00455 TaxID=1703927 RepID=UPI0009388863|nr:DUF202 domain-containing protein [Streptomyces sp. CB00455]OKK14580.1 hypothetical protein AMK16_30375 [Streptomyces sp. CB00455]